MSRTAEKCSIFSERQQLTFAADGGFTYKPAPGFVGTDSFVYTATDSKGATDPATVTITVNDSTVPPPLTPQTLYPSAVGILTGKFDYGTLASFKTKDSNTYDVKSVFVSTAAGGIVDLKASTTISGSPASVKQITLTYAGHYSKTNVSQNIYLYNFKTATWDPVNTRTVGNADDITVTVTPANPQTYVSPTGELQARVKGFRAGAQTTTAWNFYIWANLLKWDVK